MAVPDMNEEMDRLRLEKLHETRLDLEQFRAAIRVDAFHPIRLVAAGVYFSIEGQMKTAPRRKPKPRPKSRRLRIRKWKSV